MAQRQSPWQISDPGQDAAAQYDTSLPPGRGNFSPQDPRQWSAGQGSSPFMGGPAADLHPEAAGGFIPLANWLYATQAHSASDPAGIRPDRPFTPFEVSLGQGQGFTEGSAGTGAGTGAGTRRSRNPMSNWMYQDGG